MVCPYGFELGSCQLSVYIPTIGLQEMLHGLWGSFSFHLYKRFSFNWLCFFFFFFFFLFFFFLGWGLGHCKWVVWGKAKSVLSKRELTEILGLQYLIQKQMARCEGNHLFRGNE